MPPLAAPSIHKIIVFQSNKKWNFSHAISKISNKVRISKWFSLASCLRKMRFLQEASFPPFPPHLPAVIPACLRSRQRQKNIIIQARHTHVPFPNVVPTRERKEKRKYFVRKRPANFVFHFLPPKHDFAKRRRKKLFLQAPPLFWYSS